MAVTVVRVVPSRRFSQVRFSSEQESQKRWFAVQLVVPVHNMRGDGAAPKKATPKASKQVSEARKHIARKAAEFDDADSSDATGAFDHELDKAKFLTILPRDKSFNEADLDAWWTLLDIDGDGVITKAEFFTYALCAASRRAGAGVEEIFRVYDQDGSGRLDVRALHCVDLCDV